MACYHPWTAYRPRDGGPLVFVERGDCDAVTLPCGQCVGCSLEKSRQWAVRCMHEAQMHRAPSSFVTLTYKPEKCPPQLVYRDFQLFMKRLRKERGRVPFYMAGEYGELYSRPHFHALLFGCYFADRVLIGTGPGGSRLYRSAVLERLWPNGYASVGDVTFQSAAYVARYVMKKRMTSASNETVCEILDVETGEWVARKAEFSRMSLRPAIGRSWVEKFHADVYPQGKVVVNGHETNSPRYYDRRFAEADPLRAEALAYSRDVQARANYLDNVDERLSAKEKVTRARLSRLKRVL